MWPSPVPRQGSSLALTSLRVFQEQRGSHSPRPTQMAILLCQVPLQATQNITPHPGRSRKPLSLCPLPRPFTVPTSSSVFSWTPFLLFFFLSVSFFSFSGRMLSIQARSCWEKIKSRSLRTMMRPKIWGGKMSRKTEAPWERRENGEPVFSTQLAEFRDCLWPVSLHPFQRSRD